MRFDVSVVVQTVCRDCVLRAVRSVFEQDFAGTIQILVGVDIDRRQRSADLYNTLERECPRNRVLTWLNPGYSTSVRHGGVHSNQYGGSLRAALSFLAGSRLVAYCDDDDWYAPDHIRRMVAAMQGKKWAFSLCWYANPDTGEALCEDRIESVGPGRGIYRERLGGFVRPSALMIDKLAVPDVLHLWTISPERQGGAEDRLVFDRLRREPQYGETGAVTVYASIDPVDLHGSVRHAHLLASGVQPPRISKQESTRASGFPAIV